MPKNNKHDSYCHASVRGLSTKALRHERSPYNISSGGMHSC